MLSLVEHTQLEERTRLAHATHSIAGGDVVPHDAPAGQTRIPRGNPHCLTGWRALSVCGVGFGVPVIRVLLVPLVALACAVDVVEVLGQLLCGEKIRVAMGPQVRFPRIYGVRWKSGVLMQIRRAQYRLPLTVPTPRRTVPRVPRLPWFATQSGLPLVMNLFRR